MTIAGHCRSRRFVACCSLLLVQLTQAAPAVHTSHGFTLFGELKYGPDEAHFDYVNPFIVAGTAHRQRACRRSCMNR